MTITFTEHPDQAWQVTLELLQMEMPRSSFEAWVRDTKALSYKDGLLTVGVQNAYARDWLESRLSSTAARLLIGIIGEHVDVNFVVSELDLDVDDDADQDDSQEERVNPKDHQITLANSTRYEQEVKPHRVIVIPGYALRLLAQRDLSAKEMSLWLGFRQATYFDWKNDKRQQPAFTKNIPHQDVIRFANMGKTSFFREINGKDSLAAGMVMRIPDPAHVDYNNPHLDNANRWRVSMSPCLTRRDAAVIEMILASDIALAEETRAARLDAALRSLRDMTNRHPAEYLDMPIELTLKYASANVVEILRRVLGLEEDFPAALFDAAEALQNRLMTAFGSVVIPHHFLTTTAPFFGLTQSQIWTVIVLRDRCYFDYETGVEHDFVMAPKGIESLAAWTGFSVKSLQRWLTQPEVQQFIRLSKVEIPENDLGENERLHSWIAAGGQVFMVRKDEPPLGYCQDHETGQWIPRWTRWNSALDKVELGSGQSGTRVWTKWNSVSDKVELSFGQSGTPLNNLFKPLLNPSKPLNPHPTSAARSRKAAGGLGSHSAYWDFDFLMRANAVNPGTVQNFRKQLKDGLPIAKMSSLFVSWLIYAHSPLAGDVLDPVSIAVRRIQQNPHAGMPDFDRLAALKPFALKSFFDADLAGESPADIAKPDTEPCIALYNQHLAPLPTDNKRQLYRRLFGG
ncbi:MAG: hypothetical protein HN855_06310 [Anaerolineae bacterium]|jgi:hypothetical protein|nr:hypothetical protein [Anaerolineae bacterium]MBT7324750.1 hypothetical protein [Anaerolineae bacterium]